MNIHKTSSRLQKTIYLNSFLLVFISFLVLFTSYNFNKKEKLKHTIEKEKQEYLKYLEKENKNSLELAKEYILKTTDKLQKQNTPEEIVKKEILEYLRGVRFGEHKENYIFIMEVYDLNGGKNFAKEILLPIMPQNEGKFISDDIQDSNKKFYRKEYLKQIRQNGEAIVYYTYKKNKNTKEVRKSSYLLYLPELNWIIGSGAYLDRLDEITKEFEEEFEKEYAQELELLVYEFLIFILFGMLATYGINKIIRRVFDEHEKEVQKYKKLSDDYKEAIDMSTIVSKTDKNGIITYANDEFCKISGYSTEELIGSSHNIVRHPENPKEIFEDMWKTIKKDKKPWKGELKNKAKDGSTYWVKAIINPILDVDGNILEFIAIRDDITKIREMKDFFESEYNISNQQFKKVVHLNGEYNKAINNTTLLIRTDTENNITYINEKLLNLLGYKKDELINKKYTFVLEENNNEDFLQHMNEYIKNNGEYKDILKYKAVDCVLSLETHIVPIKDSENELIEYMSVSTDLTEIFELHKEIDATQKEVIYKMGEIAEKRSKETGNHVKRVAEYSKLLAELYGLSEEEVGILFAASPMHDIGKVGIPDSILNKPGKLTEEEFKHMQKHSVIGKRILSGSNRPVLKAASIVAYEHHEKYNGKGYPRKISGEDIHIYGRITALADVFDALGSDRCYKKAWELEKILDLLKEERGEHFDPKLVDLFLDNLDKFLVIRDRYKDA